MNRLPALIAATLVLFDSASALSATIEVRSEAFGPNATIVTFETGSTELPTVPGLAFPSTSSVIPQWFSTVGTFSGFFGAQGASNGVSSRYSDIAVEFSQAQGMVGAWLGNIPDFLNSTVHTVTVEAFSTLGESLGTYDFDLSPSSGSASFFGLSSPIGIARMEWRVNNSGFLGMDNLTFQLAPIPEPAVSILMLSGLLVLGAARYRHMES